MVETDSLARTALKISKLIDSEVKWASGIWSFRKEREVKLEDNLSGFCCSLNTNVSFYEIHSGVATVNLAEVYLLPEEVPAFALALRQQSFLLPPNYFQQVSKGHGICLMEIESFEPVENFVGRLNEAFLILKQQIPVITRKSSLAQ